MQSPDRHHVVIVGGGFAGLLCARQLRKAPVRITLLDKRNFHLFQPLLYQVATGGLSPSDIASPLRAILKDQDNATVYRAKVVDVDYQNKKVITDDGAITYDSLVLATGVKHHYFGNEDTWSEHAPGLKNVDDALDIRQRVLLAFENAEKELDPDKRAAWLRFVIVGAGPTGVEMAGALAELSRATMRKNFRHIDPTRAEIHLVEGDDRCLRTFPEKLSAKAERTLVNLGVTVHTEAMVKDVSKDLVTFEEKGTEHTFTAKTIVWAAGVKASGLAKTFADHAEVDTDRIGRLKVDPYLMLPHCDGVYVAGDLAHAKDEDGNPLPGLAPVAMQQGRYVAKHIKARLARKSGKPFRYKDKGNLAVIGRNAAVADFGFLRISGFVAWVLWAVVHIYYLIEFGNKFVVSFQWLRNYITRKRGARIIREENTYHR